MIKAISPIVEDIENNLYVGNYDFNDASEPTSKFNTLLFKVEKVSSKKPEVNIVHL
jgi:hypothetical protein